MENAWPYIKTRPDQRQQCGTDMGTRREKEKGKTKDTWRGSVENERRETGWKTRGMAKSCRIGQGKVPEGT